MLDRGRSHLARVGGSYVFTKGHANTEYTDSKEQGRNEGMPVTKMVAEATTHLAIRLLALRVKGKGSG